MLPERNEFAVVVLAGGKATRFPGKLERDAGGVPLLARVVANVRGIGEVYISAGLALPQNLVSQLDCPIIFDRIADRGPLGGLVSTFEAVGADRVFVVAGDAPLIDHTTFERLRNAWEDGLEAVLAERDGKIEPLCALYNRRSFLAAAGDELGGSGSVAAVAQRLKHKRVCFKDGRELASINTADDYAAVFQ